MTLEEAILIRNDYNNAMLGMYELMEELGLDVSSLSQLSDEELKELIDDTRAS